MEFVILHRLLQIVSAVDSIALSLIKPSYNSAFHCEHISAQK